MHGLVGLLRVAGGVVNAITAPSAGRRGMGEAFLMIFSVVEVEDAVAAVGGFEWGGVECSSLV